MVFSQTNGNEKNTTIKESVAKDPIPKSRWIHGLDLILDMRYIIKSQEN